MFDPRILRLVAITDDAEDRRATLVDRVAAAVRGGNLTWENLYDGD